MPKAAKELPKKKLSDFKWNEVGGKLHEYGVIHGPHNFVIARVEAAELNSHFGRRMYERPMVCTLYHGKWIQIHGAIGEKSAITNAKRYIVDLMKSMAETYLAAGS